MRFRYVGQLIATLNKNGVSLRRHFLRFSWALPTIALVLPGVTGSSHCKWKTRSLRIAHQHRSREKYGINFPTVHAAETAIPGMVGEKLIFPENLHVWQTAELAYAQKTALEKYRCVAKFAGAGGDLQSREDYRYDEQHPPDGRPLVEP